MKTLTTIQAATVYQLHRELVADGFRPDVARRLLLTALDRVVGPSGLGKVRETRELIRTPGMTPRYVNPSDRCVRLTSAGDEPEKLYPEAEQYEQQGWTVTHIQTSSFPQREVWYACPPGQVPMEHQPKVFNAEVF